MKTSDPKIISLVRGCKERWPMGRKKLQRLAEDAGAIVRIGRSVYINVGVMDRYFDDLTE